MAHFQEFEGPLDLLLDEVRRQKVTIENIAMAPIVARYLDYMRRAAERNLNLNIDWLHLAATLIHWKSRSMLAAETRETASQDPIRDALVLQLLAHRKEAAGELARRKSEEEARFSRKAKPQEAATGASEESAFVSVWDMIQEARELAHWTEKHRQDRSEWSLRFSVEHDEITVAEAAQYLRSRLDECGEALDGVQLLHNEPTAARRACIFLAMLELSRDQQLTLDQENSFGPIWLQSFNLSTVDMKDTTTIAR